jgi:hypothetical protein
MRKMPPVPLSGFNRASDPVDIAYAFARSWGEPHESALEFAKSLGGKPDKTSQVAQA